MAVWRSLVFLRPVPVSVLETVGEKLFDCMIMKASIIHFPRMKRTKTTGLGGCF